MVNGYMGRTKREYYYGWQQLIIYFKRASRENFGCFQHKQMVNVWGNGYCLKWILHIVYMYWNVTLCLKYLQLYDN
jgi:hypothetical protein